MEMHYGTGGNIMEQKTVKIVKDEDINIIIGQSHFIKTVEDIYEAIITSSPSIKFGIAFCEASGDRLIRADGNDQVLIDLAVENTRNIAAGHSFFVAMKDGFPINILNAIKNVREVCSVFCATANDVEVVIAESESGRGVLGVIDGRPPLGVEDEEKKAWRVEFLRKIGYKRG
jgi:adenosine/AMP kinase